MMKGIIGTVSPIQTGCLNRCQQGPVMLVEPGHTMYVGLTKEKIDRIIEEHIIGGKVVEEYVVPSEVWGEPIAPASLVR
jgi:(2Fe-2S) ferredoxin